MLQYVRGSILLARFFNMEKDMTKHTLYDTWQDYPVPVRSRGGCKVSWNYYRTREEAEICAKAARHNAEIALADGFDFGYCAPGTIREMPPGSATVNTRYRGPVEDLSGLYEVCLP